MRTRSTQWRKPLPFLSLFFPIIIKVSNPLEMIILLKNNTRNLKLLGAEIQLKYLIEVHGAMNGNKILSI